MAKHKLNRSVVKKPEYGMIDTEDGLIYICLQRCIIANEKTILSEVQKEVQTILYYEYQNRIQK